MKKLLLLSGVLGTVTLPAALSAAPPRLIVEIVVGALRPGDLERYADNFSDGGFRRLAEGGARFEGAAYDCLQTTAPASLSTLATGAQPSMHGVIGTEWIDYTSNRTVRLTDGPQGPGPSQLVVPTLAEALRDASPRSRTATVAAEAVPAVVAAGRSQNVFWLDSARCGWTSSAAYAEALPDWIARSNRERYNLSYIASQWRILLDAARYRNTRRHDIATGLGKRGDAAIAEGGLRLTTDYERLLYTPAGNTAVLGMAKQLIAQFDLGGDPAPDLLTISLDSARRIAEAYGPESVEAEDMLYRLDRDLADFLTFLFAQVAEDAAVVVLTAAHGMSPAVESDAGAGRLFNARQFQVIVNGFLSVRYGPGTWVAGYADKSLWLNHNLIYERGLGLAEVQQEVAVFAMQFDGVSHALAAETLRAGAFGSGYARLMQQGFYPRRSGDVVLNFMPGWIEERPRCRASSGSMYGYDRRVPLVFYGAGIGARRIRRPVDMTAVAPTLARMMRIDAPAASEGLPLEEITD